MATISELTPKQREAREQKERDLYVEQAEKQRQFQLELAREQNKRSMGWNALKDISFAPCYFAAITAVMILALCKRQIPQVLVDFLNS